MAARRSATSSCSARISGAILKASLPLAPEWLLDRLSVHAIDFYAMSEDVPNPESRVTVDGERIVLQWKRTNWDAHLKLVAKLKSVLKAAGFPIVLSRAFDKRTPSHQCGTVRMGDGSGVRAAGYLLPRLGPPQPVRGRCRFPADLRRRQPGADHRRQALRVADHIAAEDLRS